MSPKLKTNLIPTAIGSWGVAVSGTASYDLITGENTALFVTVPATLRVSNVVRINLNAGWQLDRTTNQHYLTYGAGFDWRTPDNVWTLTGEVFGLVGRAEERGTVEPRLQLGLRYRPVDEFNIDLIYGRNLAGERANWITLATVFRFKPPHIQLVLFAVLHGFGFECHDTRTNPVVDQAHQPDDDRGDDGVVFDELSQVRRRC